MNQEEPTTPVLLTLQHAAAIADTTPQGLRGWIRRGLVPRHCLKKIGRCIRIRRDLFVAWLSTQAADHSAA